MRKTILTIFKKELKDTIRDRRTLMAMVVMPMLLMPVMTIGMFKFMEYQMEKQGEKVVKISVIKEVLMGVYDSGHILLTLSSLIIYSVIAIFIATKIYSKEGVLFRD
jgi:ABC-type Na+ efflux pump permease subunit